MVKETMSRCLSRGSYQTLTLYLYVYHQLVKGRAIILYLHVQYCSVYNVAELEDVL